MMVKSVRAAVALEETCASSRTSRSPDRIASVFKFTATAVGCLALAHCATAPLKTARQDPRYGETAGPRVVAGDGAIDPSVSRRGVYMVGKPYTVGGKRYVPHENSRYATVGKASWYGSELHGRRTANGEVFDMYDITAAHPTMPLPSYARVTNLDNGDSLIVRVNDRGPYHGGRIIDLSKRAADLLDFRRAGVGRVKVEYVGRADPGRADRAMLVASLRTDGRPAELPAFGAGTMIAEAPVPPNPVPEAPVVVAQANIAPEAPVAAQAPAPQPQTPVMASIGAPVMANVAGGSAPLPPEKPALLAAYQEEHPADMPQVVATGAPANAAPAVGQPVASQPAALPAVTAQPGVLAAQTASYRAGVLPQPADASFDLMTIPNAATPIPGKALPVKLARPTQVPLPPQRSADAGDAAQGHPVRTGPAKLKIADIVGAAPTLGDTPMVTTALAYADEPLPQQAQADSDSDDGGIYVSAGSYRDPTSADQLRWVLSQAGDVSVTPYISGGQTLWRVEAGPFDDAADAEAAVSMARNAGAAAARVLN